MKTLADFSEYFKLDVSLSLVKLNPTFYKSGGVSAYKERFQKPRSVALLENYILGIPSQLPGNISRYEALPDWYRIQTVSHEHFLYAPENYRYYMAREMATGPVLAIVAQRVRSSTRRSIPTRTPMLARASGIWFWNEADAVSYQMWLDTLPGGVE